MNDIELASSETMLYLPVEAAHNNEDNSSVLLSQYEKNRLGFNADGSHYVILEGNYLKKTVCIVSNSSDCPDGKIRMNRVIRYNLRVSFDDPVTIRLLRHVPTGVNVHITAIDDTVVDSLG